MKRQNAMLLPDDIALLVTECRNALTQHELGELPLKLRKRLLLALGPYKLSRGPAVLSEGYYRRVALVFAAAEKAVPCWERRLPHDRRPRELLEFARSYVRGEVTEDFLEQACEDLEADIIGMEDEEAGSGQYGGLAVVKVARVAVYDEDILDLDSEDGDTDLDVWSWCVSYTASIAYANGAPFQPESDVNRRREFWLWWLDEALPEAYQHNTKE